jgi:hypothetical protein
MACGEQDVHSCWWGCAPMYDRNESVKISERRRIGKCLYRLMQVVITRSAESVQLVDGQLVIAGHQVFLALGQKQF